MSYLEHLRGILKVPRLQTCSFRKQQWLCSSHSNFHSVLKYKNNPLAFSLWIWGNGALPIVNWFLEGNVNAERRDSWWSWQWSQSFSDSVVLWAPAGCVCVSKDFLLDGEEEVSFHSLNLGEQSQDEKREKWWQRVSGGGSWCVGAVCHPGHCCWFRVGTCRPFAPLHTSVILLEIFFHFHQS